MIDYNNFGEFTYEDKWRKHLASAYGIAMNSKDPSTQNGAILINNIGEIVAWGANNLPDGIASTSARWERPLKYKLVTHAEAKAIYDGAKRGLQVSGKTMICCWACCTSCALSIIESGIKLLITHKQALDRSPVNWEAEILTAFELLKEANVKVLFYDGEIGGISAIRHSGVEWKP